MAQTNTYADSSAYAADSARLADRSAFSFIREDNRQVFGGVNIVVDKDGADTGDLAVFDKILLKHRYIKAGTIVNAQMPDNLHPHSVVLGWVGGKVLITPLADAGQARWAHPYEVRVAGVSPSASGTLAITVHNSETVSEEVEVSWSAGTTLAAIVASMNAQFKTLTYAGNKAWTAAVDGSDIILSHDYQETGAVTSITGTGGASGVSYVQDEVDCLNTRSGVSGTVDARLQRKNGARSPSGGCNLARLIAYYETNGSTPTSAIGLHSGTVVNRDSFENSDYCSALREAHDTYEDYLAGEHMLQWPAASGAHLQDGQENTAWLAAQLGTAVRGESEPRFPAAAIAHAYGLELDGYSTGLEAGAWWLPDVEQMQMLIRGRRVGNSDTDTEDPVNDTIVKMGGSPIYAGTGSNLWTSCESTASGAFGYDKSNGSIFSSYKKSSLLVRPVTLV